MLLKSYQQLVSAIGIDDAPKGDIKLLIHCWLSGQSVRSATWRSLHEVLRELGLEELSTQIENCLSGKTQESLRQLNYHWNHVYILRRFWYRIFERVEYISDHVFVAATEVTGA